MPKFNILSQFLKDISFESPNVPELFFRQGILISRAQKITFTWLI